MFLEEKSYGLTGKGLKKALAIFIILLGAVYAGLIALLGARFDLLIYSPLIVLGYSASVLAAEAIRALRLYIVYDNIIDHEFSPLSLLTRSLIARFSGNLVSALTPSAIGGEVVRGLVISGLDKRLLAQALAAGLADGLYDLFTNTLLAIAVLWVVGLKAIYVVAVVLGIAASLSWIIAAFALSGRWKRVRNLVERVPILGSRFVKMGSEAFLKGFSKAKVILASLSFSTFAWMVMGLGMQLVVSATCSPLDYLGSLALLLYTYLIGVVPTPAGLGAMDAWLAFSTCPTTALAWRTGSLVALAVMAAATMLAATKECRGLISSVKSK